MSDAAQEQLSLLGRNIETARLRRNVKISVLCERAFITPQTYQRLKKGEGGVSLAVLANILSALDLEDTLSLVAAPGNDEVGLTLERAGAPKRVRGKGEVDEQLDSNW